MFVWREKYIGTTLAWRKNHVGGRLVWREYEIGNRLLKSNFSIRVVRRQNEFTVGIEKRVRHSRSGEIQLRRTHDVRLVFFEELSRDVNDGGTKMMNIFGGIT